VERDHVVLAYTFELGKVEVLAVQERMVARLLLVDHELGSRVAAGLGLPVPDELPPLPGGEQAPVDSSPALAMVSENVYPADGRVVHLLAADGCDVAGVRVVKDALVAAGLLPQVIAPHKGLLVSGRRNDAVSADRSFLTARSVEADAVLIADRAGIDALPSAVAYVQEAYRHHKVVGGWGDAGQALLAGGVPTDAPGVVVAGKASKAWVRQVVSALGVHRHWDRAPLGLVVPV
jgi:catalase